MSDKRIKEIKAELKEIKAQLGSMLANYDELSTRVLSIEEEVYGYDE